MSDGDWLTGFVADVAASGGSHRIPPGTYTIDAPIPVTRSSGWRLDADDVTIVQQTDDTPIFRFDYTGTASWRISGLRLTWANQQVGNTGAIGFAFDNLGADPDSWGHYDFEIDRVRLANGYAGIAPLDTSQVNPLWGFEVSRWHVEPTWCGPVMDISAGGSGMPNNVVRRVYVRGDSIGTDVFRFDGQHGLLLEAIEINHSNRHRELYASNCRGLTINNWRTENGTITGSYGGLLTLSNCHATIRGIEAQSKTVNVPSAYAYMLSAVDGSQVDVGGLYQTDTAITAGDLHGIACATGQVHVGPAQTDRTLVYPWDDTPSNTTVRFT